MISCIAPQLGEMTLVSTGDNTDHSHHSSPSARASTYVLESLSDQHPCQAMQSHEHPTSMGKRKSLCPYCCLVQSTPLNHKQGHCSVLSLQNPGSSSSIAVSHLVETLRPSILAAQSAAVFRLISAPHRQTPPTNTFTNKAFRPKHGRHPAIPATWASYSKSKPSRHPPVPARWTSDSNTARTLRSKQSNSSPSPHSPTTLHVHRIPLAEQCEHGSSIYSATTLHALHAHSLHAHRICYSKKY